jgi:hypothetical protein
MNLPDWTHRLRALVMPRRVERDLHDEVSFHIERETKKLIDEGMAPLEPATRRRPGLDRRR